MTAASPVALTRDHIDVVAVARALADDIARDAARRDREHILPYEAFEEIRHSRLGALRVPRRYGGLEASWRQVAEVYLLLSKADTNVAQGFIPHITSVERLALHGTEEQKRHFFARVVAGDLFGVANAELGGSVRGAVATTLTRDGANWRLNGRKYYSTGSLFAQHLRVTAITPDGERVAVLIPRERDGIRLLDDWDGMGQRTTASGTTELENVLVLDSEIMSSAGWHGLPRDYTDAGVHLLHAGLEVGIGLAVLDDSVTYARSRARTVRESGVVRAAEDPFIQHAIGKIATRAHAAQALFLHTADLIDRVADAPARGVEGAALERLVAEAAAGVSEIKIFAAEVALSTSETLYEVGGASITRADANYDRHWRNARTHTTHDPLAYRAKGLGAWYLDGIAPPVANA
ncbi:alkylation response protein AidB-like acyl-CoA dehydrogenase [Angulomicrobium tetraedrale]|uniref:Dibenzothiophene monooxygenase n=1 Tax=Ancylobacter tetraedralis TaxID=217068 RepID=A0A839Z8W2_9HYPH|nr:acyl-CoA dehydrogenase family protein [Ancylobacter tetraedralis]MBB3770027.1 alkylation response protein AidB-like acyl-CoA dehydrogenase [Ancylobacter tetraedralis]